MTTPRYAKDTEVTEAQTLQEIETLLQRYGAERFARSWDARERRVVIVFEIAGRRVRLVLPLPDPEEPEFWRTAAGRHVRPEQAETRYVQARRQRLRALRLVLLAKLEAVALGITTLEREFLADVTLPDGHTVGEWLEPQLRVVLKDGALPPLLLGVQLPALTDGRTPA